MKVAEFNKNIDVDGLYSFMQVRSKYLPYYYVIITGIQFAVLKETLKDYNNGYILDHGCGDGTFAQALFNGKRDNQKRIGLDIGFNFAKEAKTKHIYDLLTVADSRKTPFADNSFDIVFSNSVIEHISGIDAVLKEVNRILKADDSNFFIFTVPLPKFTKHTFPWLNVLPKRLQKLILKGRFFRIVNLFETDEWKKILEKHGFEIVSFKTYMSDFAMSMASLLTFEPIIWAFSEKLLGRPIRIPFSKTLIKGLCFLSRYFIRGKGELLAVVRKRAK